ncbi:MAG: murein hydrolase activator EnvC family protein, partial [Candidatus Geothermincolia bacterium]
MLWPLIALILVPCFILLDIPVSQAASSLGWPVRGRVIRGFERPKAAFGEGGHQGIDIASPRGSTVRAAADGTVSWVGELPRGRFVSISHEGGTKTTCLDLETVSVSPGRRVTRGETIGTLCGTCDTSSTPSHLHFDAYLNGNPVDPRLLMNGFDSASYIRLSNVDAPGGHAYAPGNVENGPRGGLWHRIISPLRGPLRAIKTGAGFVWEEMCKAAKWTAGVADRAWDKLAYPVLRKIGHGIAVGAKWCWNNRY